MKQEDGLKENLPFVSHEKPKTSFNNNYKSKPKQEENPNLNIYSTKISKPQF